MRIWVDADNLIATSTTWWRDAGTDARPTSVADAIIGWLILSTVSSLFVVRAFYVLADRVFPSLRKPPKAEVHLAPHVAESPPAR